MNRLKKKYHLIISFGTEKALDKIKQPINSGGKKVLSPLGIEGKFLNLVKITYYSLYQTSHLVVGG